MCDRRTNARGLVIFDLDDTLLLTGRAVRRARGQLLASVFPEWTAQRRREAQSVWRATTLLYQDHQLSPLLEVLAAVMGALLPADPDIATLESAYQRRQIQEVSVDEQVLDAAEHLIRDGCAVAIVSNGDDAAQREKIARTGLDRLAPPERIIICDGVTVPHKPDPTAIRSVMAPYGSARTVLVGDRVSDVIAARLAGIGVVRIRSRCADIERATALRPMAQPDRYVPVADCYDAVRDVIDHGGSLW
jgi:HAD superfamily hydrolase (TIGR01549 family)